MKDRKMLGHDIRSLARSYEAGSLEEFCNEWLMPCVTTKENPKTKQLRLLIHGEMLQELVKKQQAYQSSGLSQTNVALLPENQSESYARSQQQEQTVQKSEQPD